LPQLKISFLCPSISRTSGGIFEIERKLAQSLMGLPSTCVEVFGPTDQFAAQDLASWSPLRPRHFPYQGPASFCHSPTLRRAFLAAEADISHLHALWTYNSIVIRQWARKWRKPYLITINGMLEKWAIRNSHWKKKIALALYERTCLSGAACIQVNSRAEYASARAFGLRNPICIIGNGIDLPCGEAATPSEPPWKHRIPQGRKILLYLGRLHPKKGLANLLKAWAQISQNRSGQLAWTLAIAGWDQTGHQRELENLASDLGLLSSVAFLGPQFGQAKASCYRNCDAFILPSLSEGLPMVILEAWSYGKPVLMTAECNLPEGFSAGAAMPIEPSADSISEGLRKISEMPDSEINAMGRAGLDLVKNRFTWPRAAAEIHSAYQWVLGRSPKPECVID
jgi:glycosyltransferase involved in cell wall biosynthesis